MAYISYNSFWESEFDNIVSKKDEIQDSKINQLNLEVYDSYKKDEKITTIFKPAKDGDVINKIYKDEKLKQIGGYIDHIDHIENDNNEFKLQNSKQPVEEILIQ